MTKKNRQFSPKLDENELIALGNHLGANYYKSVWRGIIDAIFKHKNFFRSGEKSSDPEQYVKDWFVGDANSLLEAIKAFEPYSNCSHRELLDIAIQMIEFQPHFRTKVMVFTPEQITKAAREVKASYPEAWEREGARFLNEEFDFKTDPLFHQDKVRIRKIVKQQPIDWVEWDKLYHQDRLTLEVNKVIYQEALAASGLGKELNHE